MFTPPIADPNEMSHMDAISFGVINFSLSMLYLVTIIVGMRYFMKRYKRVFPFYKSSWTFMISLCWLGILHLGYLSTRTINLFWIHICIPSSFVFLFDVLPGLLMYATFIGLVIFWGDIYVGSYEPNPAVQSVNSPLIEKDKAPDFITSQMIRSVIMALVIIILVGMLALFLAFVSLNGVKCKNTEPLLEPIAVFCIGFLYFTSIPVSCIIGFYGSKLYQEAVENRMVGGIQYTQKVLMLRRVAILILVCVCCFILRGVLLILEWHQVFEKEYLAEASYYLFLDLLPLVIMVYLLSNPPFSPTHNFATMNVMGLY